MKLAHLVLVIAIPVFAQQPPPAEAAKPRRMPEPKNLKVLKIPAAELIPTMRRYTQALGVQCEHCHVKGDFASDEKPEKETARKMIVMAQEINSKFDAVMMKVECWTCHHGVATPEGAPPLPPPAKPARPPAP